MSDIVEIISKALGKRRLLEWDINRDQLLDWSQAALTALSEAGWVVVPREPTEVMVRAGRREIAYHIKPIDNVAPTWSAMLAASQPSPVVQGD